MGMQVQSPCRRLPAAMLAAWLCAAGCSPKQYATQADRAAYGLIVEKQRLALGQPRAFNIDYRPFRVARNRRAAASTMLGGKPIPLGDENPRALSLNDCLLVAAEQQAATGVVARCFRFHSEEVLREKEVRGPVSIEVGNTHAECRGKLGLDRQRLDLEMVAAVQQEQRVKSGRFELFEDVGEFTQDLVHCGLTVSSKSRETFSHPGQRADQCFVVAPGSVGP